MKLYFLQMILVVVGGLFDDIPVGINVGSQGIYMA